MKKIKTQFTISELPLEKLTDAQAGILFKAIKFFAETGEEPNLIYPLDILFERIRNELREPKKRERVNKDKERWVETLKDFGIDEDLINDFLKIRVQKRAILTDTALKELIKNISESNFDKNELFKYIVQRGWSSYRKDWQVDLSKASSYANKVDNQLNELFKK